MSSSGQKRGRVRRLSTFGGEADVGPSELLGELLVNPPATVVTTPNPAPSKTTCDRAAWYNHGPDMPSSRAKLTVGDLKSELSRWSDETPVTFRSPLQEQEFRFYLYRPADNLLVLEINEFSETAPVALPSS